MFGRSNHGPGPNYGRVRGYSDSDDSSDSSSGAGGHEDDDFIQREIRQQQMMMKRQDEGLEMLGQSAVRLSEISMGIHEELGQQNKMLDEMEGDLDDAADNLSLVTIKTRELIRKSGGKRNFVVIVALSVLVVVLLFLIVYM